MSLTKGLSAERVKRIFEDCLFKDGEDTSDHIKAEGISMTVGFHPGRLKAYSESVSDMLSQLPDEFHETKGGGWSFLNACIDRNGNQWAEHRTMDELFMLGLGLGRVKCLLPREMWAVLPGGMPYYAVTESAEPAIEKKPLTEKAG